MFTGFILWLKRWQYIIILSAWLGSIGLVAYETRQITLDQVAAKQAKKTNEVAEERNEILNNRPDDKSFFDGLLNDPNW